MSDEIEEKNQLKKIHSNKKIRTKLNIKNKWEDIFIFLQGEER